MILMKIFIFIACCCMLFSSSKAATAECIYENENLNKFGSFYACFVQNKFNETSHDTVVMEQANGTHENGKTDVDVEMFYASYKRIEFVPRGLVKVFANLKGIIINEGSVKEIHQEDLKQYVKLEILSLPWNDIEILEAGLFDYNPELKLISFYRNKIFHIDEHVFDGLDNLEWLDLEGNKCIDKEGKTNTAVKEVINETKIKCQSNEFSSINKDLKQLDEAMTSRSIKSCQEFELKLQKIKNQVQQSGISSHAVIKEQIKNISNEGVYGKICMIDGRLVGLNRQFASLKNDTKNMIDELSVNLRDETAKETKKILERIDNMQRAYDEKFAALDASMKVMMDMLNKTREA